MRTDHTKGSVVVIVLIILVLLLGLGIAFLTVITSKSKLSQESVSSHTAYEMAQAGLDMARQVLLFGYANGWDDELVTNNTNWKTYNPDDPPIAGVGTDPSLFQWARKIAYYQGGYGARVEDNDDGDGNPLDDKDDIVTLKVMSLLPSGEESFLQALVRYKPPLYEPDSAVVTGGALNLGGSSKISGDQGTIYATGDVAITSSENPAVEQDVYTPGDITGEEKVGGDCYEGAPPPDIPSIDPSAYQSLADYELRTNGDVFDVVKSVVVGTADKTTTVLGWKYDIANFTWENAGTPSDGTFYVVDGNIDIAGNVGSKADPWQATLLVMGTTTDTGKVDIRGTGNATMVPDEDSVTIMAYNDIDITGNLDVQDGLVATHEQISISGTASISGSVVAEATTLGVYGIAVTGMGNASITYNGAMTTFIDYGDPAVIILGIKRKYSDE